MNMYSTLHVNTDTWKMKFCYGVPRDNMGTYRMKFCTPPTSQYGHASDEHLYRTCMCQHCHVPEEKLYNVQHVNQHKCRIHSCNHSTFEFENIVIFRGVFNSISTPAVPRFTVWKTSILTCGRNIFRTVSTRSVCMCFLSIWRHATSTFLYDVLPDNYGTC